MSDQKDKNLIFLGITGIVCIFAVAITALFLIFAPHSINTGLVPVVGALAAMGAVLGYFVWKRD
jgi:membrane associated rhomboid family serine protease